MSKKYNNFSARSSELRESKMDRPMRLLFANGTLSVRVPGGFNCAKRENVRKPEGPFAGAQGQRLSSNQRAGRSSPLSDANLVTLNQVP